GSRERCSDARARRARGILRTLPAGQGLGAGAEEVTDSAACTMIEPPGTVAASKPPEAARNFRRSMNESLENEFLSGESSAGKSLGSDRMRVTSANAAPQTGTMGSAALYETV